MTDSKRGRTDQAGEMAEAEKPHVARLTLPLPYRALSGATFERLCLWLIRREGFEHVEHIGLAGCEQGRDIVAQKEGRPWAFQCKQVQRFTSADGLREVHKIRSLPRESQPDHYVFIVSRPVSANARKNIRMAWGEEASCHFWAGTELDELVKRHDDVVQEFFDRPSRLATLRRRQAVALTRRFAAWCLAIFVPFLILGAASGLNCRKELNRNRALSLMKIDFTDPSAPIVVFDCGGPSTSWSYDIDRNTCRTAQQPSGRTTVVTSLGKYHRPALSALAAALVGRGSWVTAQTIATRGPLKRSRRAGALVIGAVGVASGYRTGFWLTAGGSRCDTEMTQAAVAELMSGNETQVLERELWMRFLLQHLDTSTWHTGPTLSLETHESLREVLVDWRVAEPEHELGVVSRVTHPCADVNGLLLESDLFSDWVNQTKESLADDPAVLGMIEDLNMANQNVEDSFHRWMTPQVDLTGDDFRSILSAQNAYQRLARRYCDAKRVKHQGRGTDKLYR